MAEDHECKKEGTFGEIKTEIANLKKTNDRNFEKLFKILEGNGTVGIVTQTHLNKSSLKRLWYFVGAIILVILGGAIKTILG